MNRTIDSRPSTHYWTTTEMGAEHPPISFAEFVSPKPRRKVFLPMGFVHTRSS